MHSGLHLPQRLPLSRMRAGARLLRIHARRHAHRQSGALWFGPAPGQPPVNRFDDPAGRFRVCYLGTTIGVCFAETFLRNPPVRILALEDLAARSAAAIEAVRDLRLVAIHGPGLARLGATAELASGAAYTVSQAGFLAPAALAHSGLPAPWFKSPTDHR
jgi:hypothetical protein